MVRFANMMNPEFEQGIEAPLTAVEDKRLEAMYLGGVLSVVVATGKVATILGYRQMLKNAFLHTLDPEGGSKHRPAKQEPDSLDPAEALAFKLGVIHQHLNLEPVHQSDEKVVIFAHDVVFYTERGSERAHHSKFSRDSRHEDQRANNLDSLVTRYGQPCMAYWELAFGYLDSKQKKVADPQFRMVKFAIRARIEQDDGYGNEIGLTREQIEVFYDAYANPGLDLVGLLDQLGIKFYCNITNDQDPTAWSEVSGATVRQVVVDKVPTRRIILDLIKAEIDEHPYTYGLFMQNLLAFQAEEGDDSQQ